MVAQMNRCAVEVLFEVFISLFSKIVISLGVPGEF